MTLLLSRRVALIIGVIITATFASIASASSPTPDAFSASSYWNTPAPSGAAVDPNSAAIINFLKADNDLNGCITLSGTPNNSWGMSSFVADASGPVYNVKANGYSLPLSSRHYAYRWAQ